MNPWAGKRALRALSVGIAACAAIVVFAMLHGEELPSADSASEPRPSDLVTANPGPADSPTRSTLLRGFVYDAVDLQPIAGARVGSGWNLEDAVTTDAAGRFHFVASTPPEIAKWSSGTAVRVSAVSVLTAEAKGYSRTILRLPSEAKFDTVDFAMRRGDSWVGTIVDVDGRPVAGAFVFAVGFMYYGSNGSVDLSRGRTRDDGSFVLDGMARNTNPALVVVAEGFGRTVREFEPRSGEVGTIDLGAIALPAARSISGFAHDVQGRPLADVDVSLEVQHAHGRHTDVDIGVGRFGRRASTKTDERGFYRFAELGPDQYRVTLHLDRRVACQRDVALETDRDLEGVDLEGDPGVELRVRIVDDLGVGVSNVRILSEQLEFLGTTDAIGLAVLKVPSAASQRFVPHSPTPNYEIDPFDCVVDGTEVVRLAHRVGVVSGTLVDARGAPLPYHEVLARGASSRSTEFTLRDGTFHLHVRKGENVDLLLTGHHLELAPVRSTVDGQAVLRFWPRADRRVATDSQLRGTLRDIVVPTSGLVLVAMEESSATR